LAPIPAQQAGIGVFCAVGMVFVAGMWCGVIVVYLKFIELMLN
jgi:hypothetical protein